MARKTPGKHQLAEPLQPPARVEEMRLALSPKIAALPAACNEINARMDKSPEVLILDAARTVFHLRGMDGARMQEIAETAGLNQALLHYYFRSKEKLFTAVFEQDFKAMLAVHSAVIEKGGDLFDHIRFFVRAKITFLQEHPYLPQFVLMELKRHPGLWETCMGHKRKQGYAQAVQKLVKDAEHRGLIRQTDPVQLMTNIISLCTHPFLARPMIMNSHGMGELEFDRFLESRKTEVADFIIAAISKVPKTAAPHQKTRKGPAH